MEDKKMKYALDRIEEDIAILENIETGELIKISIFNLPQNIHEGTILKKENNTYLIDTDNNYVIDYNQNSRKI